MRFDRTDARHTWLAGATGRLGDDDLGTLFAPVAITRHLAGS